MEKRKRLVWGIGTALSVHIGIAALLSGLLGFLPKPLTAKIIEVNIVDMTKSGSTKTDVTALPGASDKDKEKTIDQVQSTVNPVPSATMAAAGKAENSNEKLSSDTGSTGNSQAANKEETGGKGQAGAGNSGESTEIAKRPGEGEIANRPRLLSGGKSYPAAARSAGQQGTVIVNITINASGSVTRASLAASSGYPLLDNAAVSAAYGWRFSPATDPYGTPLAYSGNIPVEYDLH